MSLPNIEFRLTTLELEEFLSSVYDLKEKIILQKVWKTLANLNSNGRKSFLSGGYAAFIKGYTTAYTDVDIYIEGNPRKEEITDLTKYYNINNSNIITYFEMETSNLNILFNFIYVKRPWDNIIINALQIISEFDINICKIAYFPIEINGGLKIQLVEMVLSSKDLSFQKAKTVERALKYELRLKENISEKLLAIQKSSNSNPKIYINLKENATVEDKDAMFRRLKSHFEKNKSTSFQDTSTDGLMNCVSLTSSSSSSTSLPLGLMTPAKETSNFFQEKSTDRCEKDNNKKTADFFRINGIIANRGGPLRFTSSTGFRL
ncbi:uncharacterized protein LOC135267068 isoform X2 [Tribolium castaneum]|uniref:uncharacterized protein LOC135265217 n=1 Tax=Tribolium castaneum TaxID=7070 RepID=UPI00046C1C08|nr:PREDICTED: uncharacterized protein LOC103314240 isoform X2 [Tribolium castaneum]XP_008198890.1 PREDICTED: uncharacterized protein LOC103314477 isoform X2 [Tribolium castaneum]|eukprot:XP_008197918.1 PREDICTED: uncharacterized protein LOC103314240 isoform X2 [Tribolium castaneum]